MTPEGRSRPVSHLESARIGGARIASNSNHRHALWEVPETAWTWTDRRWRLVELALPSLDRERGSFGDADALGVRSRIRAGGAPRATIKDRSDDPTSTCEIGASDNAWSRAGEVAGNTAASGSSNWADLPAIAKGLLEEDLTEAHALATRVVRLAATIIPTQQVSLIASPKPPSGGAWQPAWSRRPSRLCARKPPTPLPWSER